MRPALAAAAAISAAFLSSSCYVGEQGAAYLALRSKALPAARALADPATPAATRELLERAAAVRAFAVAELGLKDTKNYASVVELDADRLATVVQACAELSFDRYLWSYPVVGKLPYRGYFDRAEAEAEAARMRERGYDALARPVDAFSTLGWLADPLFSFMAGYGEAELAELLIHEMCHATVFLKGKAPGLEQFNEELATFVGRSGALRYLERKYGPGSAELAEARASRAEAEAFASFLRGTAAELEALYAQAAPDGEKRRRKAEIIAARAEEYRALAGSFSSAAYRGFPMGRIDNAYLDLYRLYEGEPELYADYCERLCGADLRRFVGELSRLASSPAGRGDPKAAMRQELEASP
ncbi:MAG TPA: aminopeptidase [Spirochaetales bacterium]|nr:aminopeptidase [Spirochaetales bacterium]HRY55199.1 aminopeptidase [Spirochaetia bacterium]HRZ64601.1 aminopeptidase [Spirochaetia bacterium]